MIQLGVGNIAPLETTLVKTILHLICSPRGEASESLRLSRRIVDLLEARVPGTFVTRRVLNDMGIAPIDADYATSQQALADVSHDGSMVLSNTLIAELKDADYVVIGTPMHNYTVPFALKAWIDHVVRVRATFDVGSAGKTPLLSDRPVFVAIASGGRFGEHSRQPDFLTPYLSAALGTIGLHDLNFFSVQGTVFGPEALSEARNLADQAIARHMVERGLRPRC